MNNRFISLWSDHLEVAASQPYEGNCSRVMLCFGSLVCIRGRISTRPYPVFENWWLQVFVEDTWFVYSNVLRETVLPEFEDIESLGGQSDNQELR